MIDTIAKRRFTLDGKPYAKGDTVPMPLQQFNDLEPTGLVERAPAEKKAPPAKPAKPKKPLMTISEYVDGYLAKRWGEDVPADVVQFAANNAADIEQEFHRRAKATD